MGFVVHDDYWDSMQCMDEELAKDFLYAIARYRFTGIEPDPAERCYPFFLLVRKRVDLSGERSDAGRAGANRTNQKRRKTRTNEKADGKTDVCRANSCDGKSEVCCNDCEDAEKEDEKEIENNPPVVPPSYRSAADPAFIAFHADVLAAWNRETGQSILAFSPETVMRLREIEASGRTLVDVVEVIRKKRRQWEKDPKMRRYIRPDTVFKRFETYLNEPDGEEDRDARYANLPTLRC